MPQENDLCICGHDENQHQNYIISSFSSINMLIAYLRKIALISGEPQFVLSLTIL